MKCLQCNSLMQYAEPVSNTDCDPEPIRFDPEGTIPRQDHDLECPACGWGVTCDVEEQ